MRSASVVPLGVLLVVGACHGPAAADLPDTSASPQAKAEPAPIVLLDLPGDPFWEGLERFLKEVTRRGLVDQEDAALYLITDDVDVAVEEILGFYRNYHSRRFVGSTMVIRCRYWPNDEELAELNAQFSDICTSKGIWRTGPLPPERAGRDHLELKRLALEFDRRSHGRLRMLINAINAWPERS